VRGQGVPFAREYSGYLDNRSFGGAQVSRTFYARGQTGQQLLLGAYQALERQIGLGAVEMFPRTEMLDLIVIDGRARGIVTRNLITGKIESHLGDAVVLGTGGYGNVYYLSTNAKGSNATAIWRAYKRGALFANPCFTQIHPTCIPVSGEYQSKLTLMSESLRNDGRVWVPLKKGDTSARRARFPEAERDYYLERKYPSFGNLVPRDVASATPSRSATKAAAWAKPARRLSRFPRRHRAPGQARHQGALRQPVRHVRAHHRRRSLPGPMRIYPAIHYTMGGLWVDYNLMSTIPGLYVIGEANFSDHGANRLGASALMQGLADGYFVLPNTINDYMATTKLEKVDATHAAVRDAEAGVGRPPKLLENKGTRSVDSFHRELGKLMWEYCGMSRTPKG
jgi:succinate dehydrogenase / fumarate reductase flavoprotein subunit